MKQRLTLRFIVKRYQDHNFCDIALKIIFWFTAALVSFQIAGFMTVGILMFIDKITLNDSFIDIVEESIYLILSILSLIAIYGYAYKTKLLSALFWRVSFFFVLAGDLYSICEFILNLSEESDILFFVFVFLWLLIINIIYYLYAYRAEEIWSKEQYS